MAQEHGKAFNYAISFSRLIKFENKSEAALEPVAD
jgi:hypothetical protein